MLVRQARGGDGVVVKRPLDEGAGELLHREAEMLRRAAGPGVVRLLHDDDRRELVLEDAGAETLHRRLAAGPLPIEDAIAIALRLAETLERLHDRGMIHGALTPARVALRRDGGVTLLHFEDAALVGEARAREPTELGRDLAWCAPEQTGRMDRPIDARSDLYSLGAVLYAMLTGAPPFRASEPLELVHAQLAQEPILASIANPRVPHALAELADKLLQKAPERRYQSADGLVQDLANALGQWRRTGRIERFELGRGDLRRALPLPGRLYGRERELARLLRVFEEAAADGSRVVLVGGEAGVGKTALVEALGREAVRRGARFGRGMATPLSPGGPYRPLAAALRSVVRSLVASGRAPTDELRERLAGAGRAPLELLPELREVVGEPPARVDLGPREADRRLRAVFFALVEWASLDGRPLVLFLDDLQWAGDDLLRAFEVLASDGGTRGLLLVGSARTRELPPDHPLRRRVTRLERLGVPIAVEELGPLDEAAVVAMLADALRAPPERVRPLAALAASKTNGNPFFLRQLVRELQRGGLLLFDRAAREWRWDLGRIRRVAISPNVAELLAARIRVLPPPQRELLQLVACIGPGAQAQLLADVLGLAPEDVDRRVGALVDEGFLARCADAEAEVCLAHDRLQQAVYESLPAERRRALHRRIGRALLASGGEAVVFRAAEQLNLGAEAGEDARARRERALLNRRAGAEAARTAAHRSALEHFRIAISLLAGAGAARELLYELHRDAADSAYFAGEPELAERLASEGLPHAAGVEEAATLQARRVAAITQSGRPAEAVEAGTRALRELLGVELPAIDEQRSAETASLQERIAALLAGRSPEYLLDRPLGSPEEDRAFLRLVRRIAPPAFFVDHELNAYLTAASVARTLERGVSPLAIPALASYPRLLAARGDFALAEGFARTAVGLARRAGPAAAVAVTRQLEAMLVLPWRQPYREAAAASREAFRACEEAGEPVHAGNALLAAALASWVGGVELDRIQLELSEAQAYCDRAGNRAAALLVELLRRAARRLQGSPVEPAAGLDDPALESRIRRLGATPEAIHRTLRLRVAQLLRDFPEARRQAELARPLLAGLAGQVHETDHAFATAIVLLADEPTEAQRAEARAVRDRFLAWEGSCPDNFRHRRLLVEAELARVERRPLDAAALYDESIERAARGKLLHDAALANELAGRHFLALGRERIAGGYLGEARELWDRWGAAAKVRALDAEPGLRAATGFFAGRGAGAAGLDALSLLEAIETISSEIRLERLLPKLVEVCIRAVGAERGALVLEQGGAAVVRAAGGGSRPVATRDVALSASGEVPHAMIEWVRAQRAAIVIDDTSRARGLGFEELGRGGPGSALAVPLRRKDALLGTLYFENSLATRAFSAGRVRTVELLAPAIAVAIENARLYQAAQEAIQVREDFLSVASHELKTPITSIAVAIGAQLRKSALSGDASLKRTLAVADRGLKRLGHLVDQLLEVSQLDAGSLELVREPFDLARLVAEVVDSARERIARSGSSVKLIAPEEVAGRWDRRRIGEVVWDLLDNALKFGEGRPIRMRVRREGADALLEIRDRGRGIEPKRLETIFDRFERGAPSHAGGWGLGLHLARRIVEAHGGTIAATSALGAGARFTVRLPAS